MFYVYILKCEGNSLYTGFTNDLGKRMSNHTKGTGAKYTRAHPPKELHALFACKSESAARKLEYAIKKNLSHQQKEELKERPEKVFTWLTNLDCQNYESIINFSLEKILEEQR